MKARSFQRTLITYFVIGMGIPILLSGFLLSLISVRNLHTAVAERNRVLSETLVFQVGEYLHESLQDLSHLQYLVTGSPEELDGISERFLEGFVASHDFLNNLQIINDDGIVTHVVPRDETLIGFDMSRQPFFLKAKENELPYWSESYFPPQGQTPVVSLSLPVNAGLINTEISLSKLGDFVEGLNPGKEGYITITDQRAIFIAHSDRRNVLQQSMDPHYREFRESFQGDFMALNLRVDGKEMICGVDFIEDTEWAVVVYQSRSEVFAAVRYITAISVLVTFLLLIYAPIVVFRIMKNITTPLKHFVQRTYEISAGDYDIRIGAQKHLEFATLAENFDRMAGSIQRREEELKKSEDRFKILSEQSFMGMAIIREEKIVYVNSAFCTIIELPEEALLHRPFREILQLAHSDDVSALVRAVTLENLEVPLQTRLQFETRHIKWIEIYSKKVEYGNEEVTMLKLIDITEKKTLEEQEKHHQRHLVQTDRLSSLGVLVAGMAHEINNPNQFIMSNTPLVMAAWENVLPILKEYYEDNGDFLVAGKNFSEIRDQIPQLLAGIADGAKRIDRIVGDLKRFTREGIDETMSDLDINLVIASTITLLSGTIQKATKKFSTSLAKELPKIRGNTQKLEQVVVNLVLNACQAVTGREQAVTVMTDFDEKEGRVRLKVRDEGRGIAEEDLFVIMNPFFTTKRESGGIGLGLSISHSIVEEHGGTMRFESKPGRGTTVTVSLPPAEAADEVPCCEELV